MDETQRDSGDARTKDRREQLVALAREEYAEAEASLADLEAKLVDRRERKKKALALLRLYDPQEAEAITAAEETKQAERKLVRKQHPGTAKVGRENRERMGQWLREHADDPALAGGFTATRLTQHPDWNGLPGPSAVTTALPILEEEGIVRLDRYGWPDGVDPAHKGRATKVWKVVGDATT